MDELIQILENTLSHRHNLWMFYTIIVTSVFGLAFAESYKALTVFPRVVISAAVGLVVWYNFYSLIINTLFIHELVAEIRSQLEPDSSLQIVFNSTLTHRYNPPDTEIIHYLYFFVNCSLGIALWWDECVLVAKRLKNKLGGG